MNDNLKKIVKLNPKCEDCGSFMQPKYGPYGPFWGCSRYPNCKFKITIKVTNESPYHCKNCGSTLKLKTNTESPFYGCISYPKCKYTRKKDEVEEKKMP